ncbi:hypothetical protein AVKW3434_21170 [Acidovorax sp. SUPP3434]|uniref:hypothetical protein n=1 Tax=Acidovorax sp. SUPP3434 TaxID=2920880 RepID=UPI0023DE2A0A|nr:hypothetical protein [Acidovorax sp. SUPP3434]GKT01945.1 hypothetical protein AVKW3434_21170 [Acidovorax sp. SUPP3434]
MNGLNVAVYVEGYIYPDSAPKDKPVPATIEKLKKSGFTTAILGLFHISGKSGAGPEAMGDIYFNNTLIIADGSYVGAPEWPGLVGQILGGTVTTICASIGGGGVSDYEALAEIYKANNNSFDNTPVQKNFAAFRKTFPAVSIVDMDCEETYDEPSFVAFCRMLIDLGFAITFCPYTMQDFWVSSLAQLNDSSPGSVKWVNLQCYSGGYGNSPDEWASTIANSIENFQTDQFIIPGDSAETPAAVNSLMQTFEGMGCVGGGVIWTLDMILKQSSDMQSYSNAIVTGLNATTDAGAGLG